VDKREKRTATSRSIRGVTGGDLPEIANKNQDLGEGAVNSRYVSMNVLARDKLLYDGHAVAAVAAVNPHVAEEAVKLIEVYYETLPTVMTVACLHQFNPSEPRLQRDQQVLDNSDAEKYDIRPPVPLDDETGNGYWALLLRSDPEVRSRA
jgi:CO/xanthine dehydrogenase Mo-binding subunit